MGLITPLGWVAWFILLLLVFWMGLGCRYKWTQTEDMNKGSLLVPVIWSALLLGTSLGPLAKIHLVWAAPVSFFLVAWYFPKWLTGRNPFLRLAGQALERVALSWLGLCTIGAKPDPRLADPWFLMLDSLARDSKLVTAWGIRLFTPTETVRELWDEPINTLRLVMESVEASPELPAKNSMDELRAILREFERNVSLDSSISSRVSDAAWAHATSGQYAKLPPEGRVVRVCASVFLATLLARNPARQDYGADDRERVDGLFQAALRREPAKSTMNRIAHMLNAT